MLLTGLEPVSIGRDPSNSLAFKDDMLSRFHCVIEKDGASFVVRDLKSRNGTLVNDQRVERATLKRGDRIRVGRVLIRFQFKKPGSAVDQAEPAAADAGPPIDWESLEPTDAPAAAIHVGGGDGSDSAERLGALIDSLTDKAGDVTSMALINARGQTVHESDPAGTLDDADQGAHSVAFLRTLLRACFLMRATDLHVEPRGEGFQLRVRVDGTMVSLPALDLGGGQRLLRLVKVLCDIDISQVNVVQDGHFSAHLPQRHVDFRVSYTPSMYGQKLVVRVLDLANAPQRLDQMHLPRTIVDNLTQMARQDAGMVLVCGPTGSGKTTTLYALLRQIEVSQRNVITIEDPVEYQVEGVTQLPVNETQGNSFSKLLRSVLRQDPDVILVGEIRDDQTASIALQAAMTGHLVLSTVHARDTVGTVFRLLNLGVEPYTVASGLNLVLAQRLVRQLCPHCKSARQPTPQQAERHEEHGVSAGRLYGPVGCARCLKTGYLGRRAAFEMLRVTDELRDALVGSPQIQDVRRAVRAVDQTTLEHSVYQMMAQGITSMEEIEQVLGVE